MKKAPKKIKAAIGASIASLLTGLGVMMHAEASKAQDFLVTPRKNSTSKLKSVHTSLMRRRNPAANG